MTMGIRRSSGQCRSALQKKSERIYIYVSFYRIRGEYAHERETLSVTVEDEDGKEKERERERDESVLNDKYIECIRFNELVASVISPSMSLSLSVTHDPSSHPRRTCVRVCRFTSTTSSETGSKEDS